MTQSAICATNSRFSSSRFTGKERDTESNNDYFFARYYNSAIGRFTTPDWSAKVVPIPYAQAGDPQSLNLYAYVRNNPITHVDPDGHRWSEHVGCNAFNYGDCQEDNSKKKPIPIRQNYIEAQQQGVAASCNGCSMNGAAGAAEKSALGMTVNSQHHGKWQEFGGWILKAVDGGGYSYTNPVATSGADGHFNPLGVSVPDGYVEVGYYHTHPHFTKDNVEGEGFSGPEGDVGYIANHPGFGTAFVADTVSRNMYRITPRPGGDITPGVDSRGRTTWGTFVRHIPGDPYQ